MYRDSLPDFTDHVSLRVKLSSKAFGTKMTLPTHEQHIYLMLNFLLSILDLSLSFSDFFDIQENKFRYNI